jgi:undecaprenyl-diphosphatase
MASDTKQPPKQTAKQNGKSGLWIAFFIGLALLVISMIVATNNPLGEWQASLLRSINNETNSLKTPALVVTEGLGAAYPIILCILIPLLFKKYRLAWRFFFTTGGAVVGGFIVKYLVNEPRPTAILHGNLHVRAIETGPGFPSGHMLAATALALTLWFILPKTWRWLSVLWILLVAWSRLYLGVHTPADIISGFAIGLMAVCFVRLLPKKIAEPLKLDEE